MNDFREIYEAAGKYTDKFVAAVEILAEVPEFQAKVVNSFNYNTKTRIFFDNRCPKALACVGVSCGFNCNIDGGVTLHITEKNLNNHYMISGFSFASMLVHEADHVEWCQQSKFKRLLSFIIYNPITNFDFDVPWEVRARKAQEKFARAYAKATNDSVIIRTAEYCRSLITDCPGGNCKPNDIAINYVDNCYKEAALGANDLSICKNIVNSFSRLDCMEKLAVQNKDISICIQIKTNINQELRVDNCRKAVYIAIGDYNNCEKLEFSFNRDSCYFTFAKEKKSEDLCRKIMAENFKARCLAEL